MVESNPRSHAPRPTGNGASLHSIAGEPDPAADEVRPAARWTADKMTEFLRMLAATHSVSAAAKSVGMSRQSAYKLRSRLEGKAFDVAWNQAFHQSYVNLPYAALERALNGYEVPHYYKGELIGTSRRYDERLTVALLKLSGNSDTLVVGSPIAAARSHAERFAALLDGIAAEGEMAEATEPPRADSANLSPTPNKAKAADLRGFQRMRAG